MDDPYIIQVIDEIKKIFIISRDRAYKNYYKININKFAIINNDKNNNEINIEILQKGQFINLF